MDLKNELPAVSWRRSSYTGPNGGNCVEVAPLSGARVAVRDLRIRFSGRWLDIVDVPPAGWVNELAVDEVLDLR